MKTKELLKNAMLLTQKTRIIAVGNMVKFPLKIFIVQTKLLFLADKINVSN
ncbi:hypothetical protein [Adhaeribacter terreus]|uniref:Uncharacterized protein n=1 Tax=Adhaeribacter terreus TaxID=529703 RepID=A0ABW0EBG6_9BACT